MSKKPAERMTTPDETKALFERIIREGIAPFAERIAMAYRAGKIAVVFFEIAEGDGEFARGAQDGARAMGWCGGKRECGILDVANAEKIADKILELEPADSASAAWFRGQHSGSGEPPVRIYVLHSAATFCMNYTKETGYRLPASARDHRRRVEAIVRPKRRESAVVR